MMFKKVLVDLHAEIELPRETWGRTLEAQASSMEREAKDLTEFIRDHRSRDSYQISIVREYKTICSFCQYTEERDADGSPVCCQKAFDEWKLTLTPSLIKTAELQGKSG